MHFGGDKDIEEKIRSISLEIKGKRDAAESESAEKKYYRSISKGIDKMLKTIKQIK